ncbi:echinoderm microtubule-associated protein-like 2 isoform X2 [Bradysia coprophila]|uniref:echinoderm microtubule-associated protein-like 2 isoform X2 n=1 Tax=Bradysia coprophila TaxID=38358 RepID=UPI00187D9501|nr:echinoderm microtubule-associated protein-like 2 isoform X2 [Bradysia coprophila]
MNGFKSNSLGEIEECSEKPSLQDNGNIYTATSNEFFTDEMLQSENSGLAGRVQDLERKVLTQQDEIVCLRSTLADVLRRLNLIEGNIDRGSANLHGGRSAPNTPSRTSTPSFNRVTSQSPTLNSSSSTISNSTTSDWKLRKPAPRATNSPADLQQRRSTPIGQGLSQSRSKSIHHSNGSLHSDSPSSSSVSPAPSPSPRPTSAHASLQKKWSSTSDFSVQSSLQGRLSTKSMLNLNTKSIIGHVLKHGTHTCSFNEDDGSMKFYLRGRPIVLHAPTDVRDSFEIAKVQPAPSKKLKLDWVYGYRGRDCRSNLYQLPTGEMAYFVAAVVVLYNVDEQSQRHYVGHTDDIKSLSVHPNKLLVATGQAAGKEASPHIRLWNSVSLATVAIIGNGEFSGPVNALSFSRADGGVLLAAIEDSPDKIISVWEIRGDRGQRITETRCSVDTIVCVEFHPLDRNQLVTAGKNHLAFWTLDQNGTLYKRMGVFEGREKPKYVTCIAFTQSGDVISGDSNGNVIVWGRGTNIITRFFKKVHDGSIFSLCALKDGRLASGGGKDGRIVLFDVDMNPTSVEMEVEPHFGAVRVIAEGKGSQFLIGTTRNCIMTGSFDLGLSPVIMGHTDEVWGLAVHPNLPQFVTGGRDRLLQLWDSLSHSVVWSKDIGEQIQSCAFSTDGELVAVGTVLGKWMVFDTLTRELLAQYMDGQEPIQTIKFSPDGNLLAIGSRDNFIYIYQVGSKRLSKIGRCSGHSSFVTHLDWSEDSHQLRSNSGDYEVLYWNAELCRQITSPTTLRDVKWASQTCSISFQTVGVWPENADGSDVNSVGRSSDGSLLVSGDDWGKIKLYAYPTSQPKSLAHTYGGHSSHVTGVEFMQDDARIISIGGNDTSVMQWTVC